MNGVLRTTLIFSFHSQVYLCHFISSYIHRFISLMLFYFILFYFHFFHKPTNVSMKLYFFIEFIVSLHSSYSYELLIMSFSFTFHMHFISHPCVLLVEYKYIMHAFIIFPCTIFVLSCIFFHFQLYSFIHIYINRHIYIYIYSYPSL